MTTLTFNDPIELVKLADILTKLNEITPETNLQVSLKDNERISKIIIFPSVPEDKKEEMEKLAEEIGATLEM